ncbi:hypothetical protein B0H13DRAFT_2303996 [Mycena leptocephala]|nr:hypothetical protein B0H13DRAFT_2303996 [Mycena leptocephala]
MSEEYSELETDDEEKKIARQKLLISIAKLGPDQQEVAVWALVHPDFQSKEACSLPLIDMRPLGGSSHSARWTDCLDFEEYIYITIELPVSLRDKTTFDSG